MTSMLVFRRFCPCENHCPFKVKGVRTLWVIITNASHSPSRSLSPRTLWGFETTASDSDSTSALWFRVYWTSSVSRPIVDTSHTHLQSVAHILFILEGGVSDDFLTAADTPQWTFSSLWWLLRKTSAQDFSMTHRKIPHFLFPGCFMSSSWFVFCINPMV